MFGWLRERIFEWRSSRGRPVRQTRADYRLIRDITGPIGAPGSPSYNSLKTGLPAYRRSFEQRIPPSAFVSERDKTRVGSVVPLSERCLEDFAASRPGRQPDPTDPQPTDHEPIGG